MEPEDRAGEQTGEDHRRHRPADERLIGGQGEDEEAEVATEVRDPSIPNVPPWSQSR